MVDLVRIELENFRCFFDKKDIDIGFSDKKLVVFEGNTGDGKSSLLEAINWCLFGYYPTSLKEEKADFVLFNQQALVNSKKGDIINCKVILTFEKKETPENEKITFSRSAQLKRIKYPQKNLKGIYEISEDEFTFVNQGGGTRQKFSAIKWEGSKQRPLDENVIATRESYFPGIVSDYYMIYGENFIDPRNPDVIKLATEKNCFADIFDKISGNLSKVKNEVIKNGIKNAEKKDKLEKLIHDLEDDKENKRIKKEELELTIRQKIEIEKGISKIDNEHGKSGGNQRKVLSEERKIKEMEIRDVIKDIISYEKEISGDEFKLFIELLAEPSMKSLLDELNNRVKKGEIPPNIKIEFINSLIKKKKCICNRKLEKKETNILETMRDEYILADNYQSFLDLKYNTYSNIKNIPSLIDDYLNKTNRLEELKEKRIGLDERLKIISNELMGLKDLQKLEEDRTKLNKIKETLETDIIILNTQINGFDDDIKSNQLKVNKFEELGSYEGKKASTFINNLLENLKEVKKEVIDSTRKDIESYASEVYRNLYQTTTKIKKIELDERYNVRVIIIQKDKKEYVKTTFSTGEGLVFAISFLTALRKYSGYNGPIFLDSPYSVLDPLHRVRVSLNLPKSVPGQIIILTRPDTFADTESKMESYINKIITLKKEREWHTNINVREAKKK